MPFILFAIGLMLAISGVKGTQSNLFALLKHDFSGSGSFLPWIVSIGFIGGLGYFSTIRPVANAFLALVIVVMFLSNGGFFAKFSQQTGIGMSSHIGNVGGSIGAANIGSVSSLGQMPVINLSNLGF